VKVVKASRNSQDDLKSTGQWLFWLHSTDKFLNLISVATSTMIFGIKRAALGWLFLCQKLSAEVQDENRLGFEDEPMDGRV
jgi:hypothetical protein